LTARKSEKRSDIESPITVAQLTGKVVRPRHPRHLHPAAAHARGNRPARPTGAERTGAASIDGLGQHRASRIHRARIGKLNFAFGMNKTFLVSGAISVLFLTSTWSEITSPDAGAITAAVHEFHDAFRRGDAKAVMEVVAPDAVILESGAAETHSSDPLVRSRGQES
jgi:hypothetical protein